MPTYTQPVGFNTLPQVAVSGQPAYFYGSMPVTTSDCIMQITSVACASDVATIVATIQAGNVPSVGQLITVQGTTAASGAYNVTAVAIASITGNQTTGVYTITYACTTANLGTTASGGKAYVPIQETFETLAANQSVAIYVPAQEPMDNGQKTITVATTFPTMPTAATVTLYTALQNSPIAPGNAASEWTAMGTVAVIASSAYTTGPIKTWTVPAGRWFCLVVSGITGSGTITSKMIF